jgi:tetratricopeptide (TPR) repeat protein
MWKTLKAGLLISCVVSGVAVSAQSANKMLKEADRLFETRQYENAYRQYLAAAETDSRNSDAFYGMGISLYNMGRISEAYSELQKAASLDKKSVASRLLLGKIALNRGEYSEALTYLTEASSIDKKNEDLLKMLFTAQIRRGDFELAAETADRLHGVRKSAESYHIMGEAADSLKRYAQAEELYLKARFEDPAQVESYIGSAHARYKQDKAVQALEDLSKALDRDKTNADALALRSEIYASKLNYNAAVDDLSALVSHYPENIDAFTKRARIYTLTGQYANAVADWNKVIMHEPQNHKALYGRAMAYESMQKYDEAIEDYEALRKLSPYDEEAARMLAAAVQRRYELNRETAEPIVEVSSYRINNQGEIEIPQNQTVISIAGKIEDKSRIKYLQINGIYATLFHDSVPVVFTFEIKDRHPEEIKIEAADEYDNTVSLLYRVKKTEVNPPKIQMIAPFSPDEKSVSVAGNISEVDVEGRIWDDSQIVSVMVNNVQASYDPKTYNPVFRARVRIMNKEFLTVTSEDEYGNKTVMKYRIERDGQIVTEDNPMGKTWVVFIENSNYQSFASIDGPARDVNTMKQAFSAYVVHNTIHKQNLTKTEMERFFSIELRDLVRSNEVNSLLIWYAGHGKYINDTGYWIPVDAARDDEFTYFNINLLKANMEAYSKYLTHTLVITDACESGPSFAEVTRDELSVRDCNDWEAAALKSSQVFSSAGYELASDNSQFTRTFSGMLNGNPDDCMPIETVVIRVSEVVRNQGYQTPKFGVMRGWGHEDGTFFFIRKNRSSR